MLHLTLLLYKAIERAIPPALCSTAPFLPCNSNYSLNTEIRDPFAFLSVNFKQNATQQNAPDVSTMTKLIN